MGKNPECFVDAETKHAISSSSLPNSQTPALPMFSSSLILTPLDGQ